MINILIILCAYIIGSIPTGWLIARCYGIKDITQYGSGNIGATNVARTIGITQFFIVLIIDSLKAYSFMLFIVSQYKSEFLTIECAMALLLGNSISIFLKGKGGKGIATSLGIFLALAPQMIGMVFCVWLCAILITRNMGISSVMGLFSVSFFGIWLALPFGYILLCLFTTAWGVWRHASNIRRYFWLHKVPV